MYHTPILWLKIQWILFTSQFHQNLDVQTLGYQWLRKAGTHTPKVVVNTKLSHTAGHRIPDG